MNNDAKILDSVFRDDLADDAATDLSLHLMDDDLVSARQAYARLGRLLEDGAEPSVLAQGALAQAAIRFADDDNTPIGDNFRAACHRMMRAAGL